VPIPFLKAIDVSPLALVSENVAGSGLAGSSTSDALESGIFMVTGRQRKDSKGKMKYAVVSFCLTLV
jgi:hypothetical protein